MKANTITNVLLAAITLLLFALVLERRPEPVMAQTPDVDYYVEPGTFMVRAPDDSQNIQIYAKVMVDLHNGRIWAFPTLSPLPYPSDLINNKPQTSRPFLLGRFALEDTKKYVSDLK